MTFVPSYKMILEMKGYRVVEAADGKQAFARVLEEHPDLILMDLGMPVMNGWEATRHLRGNLDIQEIPIVGLSAHCEDDWYEEAIEAGCNECIQKPIDDVALDKVLSQFLNRG
jgi:two-component system, cell cycle response regulator DivK